MRTNKRFLTVLSAILLLAMLAVPMTASAARFTRATGFMMVPRNAQQAYTLTVGEFSVMVPAGAMPRGGPVILQVTVDTEGSFRADFLPHRSFAAPVLMTFGSAEEVFYHDRNTLIRIQTDNGQVWMDHFSRYSGWF